MVLMRSVSSPEVHIECGLEASNSMGDSGVVLSVGLIRARGVGAGEFQVRLEDLDLAVILGIEACLSTLVVVNGEVFDGR